MKVKYDLDCINKNIAARSRDVIIPLYSAHLTTPSILCSVLVSQFKGYVKNIGNSLVDNLQASLRGGKLEAGTKIEGTEFVPCRKEKVKSF